MSVTSLARLAETSTEALPGIGPKRAATLAELGIRNVADMLHHVPRRYVDRSSKPPIADITAGAEVTLIGEVVRVISRRVALKKPPKRSLLIVEAVVRDETASMRAIWFNQKFRVGQLTEGSEVALSGEVEVYKGSLRMKMPEVDELGARLEGLRTGRLVPIHSRAAKLSLGDVRRAIHNALRRSDPVEDTVPVEFRAARGLMGRHAAFQSIHFPESFDEVRRARRRLVYDEFFRLQTALAVQKKRLTLEMRGVAHKPSGKLVGSFVGGLPYALTGAQRRVIDEIAADLRSPHPMHRLLQGEVGSGKTVVAVSALLHGVEGGRQGAIMAPTEVLAEQHYLGARSLLAQARLSPDLAGGGARLGMESLFASGGPAVRLALLTGSTAAANYAPAITRSELLADAAAGRVDILVGTHALIQEGVGFDKLGVVVVDEQHRFGVAQRVQLKEKADAATPDLLIMTATPIPRTLSMTLYGDLDVSVIDQMPPGRAPVATRRVSRSDEALAWRLIEREAAEGRQAFVVCPLVEDSSQVEAASASAERERLSALMPGLRVGLIHGQLKSAEKERVMAAFRAREIDVLVSTTVVEVGVDVPNATVMVVEDADRFGLSQLHQLRGRVGRGQHAGSCVLIADPAGDEAERRLAAMTKIADGLKLAEEDLRIRGQGTVFGARQSGLGDLRLADVLADSETLAEAREDAFSLVESDPTLSGRPELVAEIRAMLGEKMGWLLKS